MGWRFSRSINLGPLRINLSKRGLGASVGAGPFRVGRSATGRSYGSARIPGTGLSYRTGSKAGEGADRGFGAAGCVVAVIVVAVLVVAAIWLLAAIA